MKRKARFESEISENEFSDISTPVEVNNYVDISLAVAKHIQNFVNSKEFKQKDIAEKLDKHESEISKWFNGFHNLTLKSIIKLESVCSIRLLNPEIFRNYACSLSGIAYTSNTVSSNTAKREIIAEMYTQVDEKSITSTVLSKYSNIGINTNQMSV